MSTILAPTICAYDKYGLNNKQAHSANGNNNNNTLKRKLSSISPDNDKTDIHSTIVTKKPALLKTNVILRPNDSLTKTNGRKKSAHVVRSKVHQMVYNPEETFLSVFPSGKQLKLFIGIKHLVAYMAEHKSENADDKSNPKHNNNNKKIWGTDLYTCDSDIITACHHSGKLKLEMIDSSGNVEGVVVSLRIFDSPQNFVGSYQNSVQSEPLDTYSGKSFVVQDLMVVNKMSQEEQENRIKLSTTTASDSNLVDRFLPNVTVVFNLSNEPRMKYTLNTVADKGFENSNYTSFRLMDDVLFVETQKERFELCRATQLQQSERQNKDSDTGIFYRWTRVRSPHTMDSQALAKITIPLAEDHVTVLHTDLRWDEIQWGTDSVCVRGTKYNIWNCHYHKRTDSSADINAKTNL